VIGGNKYIPGRGINIVVMDPQSKQIMNTKTFDTYETEKESIRLVEFIKSLADGLIVVATTYDEASHRITYDARNELASIGSSHIHSLDYRDSWSLVGQKGLMGVSPYEVIHDRVGQGWGAHATIKECVPLKIESVGGQNVVLKNGKRGDFCKQYEGYGDFCSEENINKPLQPKSLDDESLKKNPAYSTPILVIPGLDLYALRKTLDSLLEVPGLNPDVVMVGNDGDFSEPKSLVDLYGFKNMILQITTKYQYHMHKGMEEVFKKFPKSEYVIVVEEQLQVSPDFLNYFAQTLPLLEKDSSILAISAFNQNGFMNTSGDPTRLYRTEDFPGLGWVLRKSVWNELQPQLKDCCDSRSWDQWLKGNLKGREMVVPDVSRVAWFKKDGFSSDQSFLDTYFNDRRTL
uniref:Alpha-1,3-mannosyl-glycoprotein 2-beta-N-acetylglucosaminyltransferase n=1 Tax=Saccoglossus kowalevskii TaxID=10224 RepID=A0ABM0MB92_SACKO